MASINEYLINLQKITQTNLEILQAINDSFQSKQNHLSVNVAGQQYALPSFISLENKINTLTANFENLVSAPESGEAFFNFGGNSRAIQVRSYNSAPNSIVLPNVATFGVEQNDIFKDFVSPKPYVNFSITSLPDDISKVVVKKIVPISDELKAVFFSQLQSKFGDQNVSTTSAQMYYKDFYKILANYKEDVDYIEYDTKLDLPIRKNNGSGIYVIEEIIKDTIDDNLENFITIKIRSDMNDSNYMNSLSYRLFDETIERFLKIGDQLVTFDGLAKMEITEIHRNTNSLTVKVTNGEFLNLVESTSNDPKHISKLSQLKFYSPIDFNEDKYIKIPLEEDQYIYIAVAALNERLNVQSSWGSGVFIDTYNLINGDTNFKEYYKSNVKNVGDILYEMTSLISNNLSKYNQNQYTELTKAKPVINKNNLLVTQINKHLNNSSTVQHIRSLYSQKKDQQIRLSEVQKQIDSINQQLASVSFDDTSNIRSSYTAQLNSLSTQRNEINTSITKLLNEISIAANNSEVPIENAKYRIRGFYDCSELINSLRYIDGHIMGIRVQYRYKNNDQEQGYALSINDQFIFSDWNNMDGFDKVFNASYDRVIKSELQSDNDNINEPSYNQIDIPISQGETVDIRLKVVYDLGYPFVQVTSDWSDIINIEFPDEYLKDVQILDIIEENNKEIEANRFTNILKTEGIPSHIEDKILDQDITYFHKPENIASGFYTSERRIIPLKDKLSSMDASIMELFDEIKGSANESLTVSIKHGGSSNTLYPYQINNISVAPYDSVGSNDNAESIDGNYSFNSVNNMVSTVLNISILNNSDHTAKLFSLFPGDRNESINNLKYSKFDASDYSIPDSDQGVYIYTMNQESFLQTGSQFITFRIKDVNNGVEYYREGDQSSTQYLSFDKNYVKHNQDNIISANNTVAFMYPYVQDKYALCMDSDTLGSYLTMAPHEEIVIPIIFEYRIMSNESINKTMTFDLRSSLYKDPITYTFRVNAKNTASTQDKVVASNRQKYTQWHNTDNQKYNITIK